MNEMTKVMQFACDAINLTDSVVELMTTPNQTDSKIGAVANIAISGTIVACGGAQVVARLRGVSHNDILRIKSVECVVHFVNTLVQFFKGIIDLANHKITKIEFLQKGVADPYLSFARSVKEAEIHQENHYLSLTAEERAKECRYVQTGFNYEHPKWEKKAILEDECKANLSAAESKLSQLMHAELTVRLRLQSEALHKRLMNNLMQESAPGTVHDVDPLDLLALPTIPQELHNDPLLNRVICCITLKPVRDPVGDPNGVHIYERAAIMKWLNIKKISPMTQLPLYPHMLRSKPALKALIDARLQFHTNRLKNLTANN